jgi:quinohemoprotein ethanol dehydrogenase
VQYIAILAGAAEVAGTLVHGGRKGNANRILAFRLDGGATPVPRTPAPGPLPEPPAQSERRRPLQRAQALRHERRLPRELPALPVPDLRRLPAQTHAAFKDIVLRGALQPRGMPRWDDLLSEQDVEHIHDYLVSVQRAAYADQQKRAPAAAAAPALKEGHL